LVLVLVCIKRKEIRKGALKKINVAPNKAYTYSFLPFLN
jgi:hypothetical protein